MRRSRPPHVQLASALGPLFFFGRRSKLQENSAEEAEKSHQDWQSRSIASAEDREKSKKDEARALKWARDAERRQTKIFQNSNIINQSHQVYLFFADLISSSRFVVGASAAREYMSCSF